MVLARCWTEVGIDSSFLPILSRIPIASYPKDGHDHWCCCLGHLAIGPVCMGAVSGDNCWLARRIACCVTQNRYSDSQNHWYLIFLYLVLDDHDDDRAQALILSRFRSPVSTRVFSLSRCSMHYRMIPAVSSVVGREKINWAITYQFASPGIVFRVAVCSNPRNLAI